MYLKLVNSWRKHFRSTYYQDPTFKRIGNSGYVEEAYLNKFIQSRHFQWFWCSRTLGLVLVFGSEGEMIKRDDSQHLTSSTIWWCGNFFQGCQLCGCGGFHASGMASISGENVASQPAGDCCHQQACEVCWWLLVWVGLRDLKPYFSRSEGGAIGIWW